MISTIRTGAFATAAVAALLVAPSASQAQETINATFITGYAPSFTWPKAFIEYFAPEVDKKLAATGKYKMSWNMAHSGTVVKPRGELEGVQSGLGDLGIVVTAFHADRVPLYNIAYVTPFTTSDIHLLQSTYHKVENKFAAEYRKDWDAIGQVALFEAATAPMDTYWVHSRIPLTSISQLKGMKISAAGPNLPWVTSMGAAGINSAATDWFQHLNTGLAEAVLSWPDVSGSQKLCEPAKHVLHGNIGGIVGHIISVNKSYYEGLPEEVRNAFLATAPGYARYQADIVLAGTKKQTEYCTKLQGMNIVVLDDAARAAWAKALPPLALDWAKGLDGKGRPGTELLNYYMAEMRAAGVTPARAWDKE
jgi:TRAP-type C4-dicarboxylate transport system substrate-binding protein